jgi:hypothetical protein
MGGTHKWTCGAVNAAAVIAGILIGRDEPTVEPAPAYLMMRELIADCEVKFGTALCSELTGIDPNLPLEQFGEQYKMRDTAARVCNDFERFTVQRFYELLEEYESEA